MAFLEYVIYLASLVSRLNDYSGSTPEENIRELQKAFYNSDELVGKLPGNAPPDIPFGDEEFFNVPNSAAEIDIAHTALHGENGEGDILGFAPRAGIKDTNFRWPGYPGAGNVPYVIDRSLSGQKALIEKAMEQYHKHTCIKFVKRKNERNYINIVNGNGCSSFVGNMQKGPQSVVLGRGCHYIGTVVHELGHAIGLYHEHQRSDRDKYITVYDVNVRTGLMLNFRKTDPNKELIFTTYDYKSVMHYGNYAFSKRPTLLKTMEAKNGETLLDPYHKPGLTNPDIETVKKLYKCK